MFTSKYDKGKKSLDLCALPPFPENLKLHMRRASYVARIFNSANMLQMDLDSPFQHGWNKNLATVWSDIAFPEDISDMFFVMDERNVTKKMMRVQATRAQRNTCLIQVIVKRVTSNIIKEF